jgi:two-component system nitrate/nitrite response regulator NarL
MERRTRAVIIGPSAALRRELCAIIEKRDIEVVESVKTVKDAQTDSPPELILLCSRVESYQRELRLCRKRWPAVRLMHISRSGKAEYQLTSGGVDGYADLRLSEDDLVAGIRLIDLFGCSAAVFGSRPSVDSDRLDKRPHQTGRANKTPHPGNDRDLSSQVAKSREIAPIDANGGANVSRRGVDLARLSTDELEVLDAVALGLRNKAIAKLCGLSEATVNTKIKRIMHKLGVSNRTQAALWRIEMRAALRQ